MPIKQISEEDQFNEEAEELDDLNWDYRVVVDNSNPEIPLYCMAEVYYNGEDKIISWISDVEPIGETLNELKEDLEAMNNALNLPVLEMIEGKLIEKK